MTVSEMKKLPVSELVAISPKLITDLLTDWQAMYEFVDDNAIIPGRTRAKRLLKTLKLKS